MEIAENQGAFLAWVKRITRPAPRERGEVPHKDFVSWVKQVMGGASKGPRVMIVSKAFCKGYRKEFGDSGFYELIKRTELWGGEQQDAALRFEIR